MNERIRELAEQARQYAIETIKNSQDPTEWSTAVFEQKFAELIIQECITSIYKSQNITPGFLINLPSDQLVLQIKKHFGVD
jgi:hypothetical protein